MCLNSAAFGHLSCDCTVDSVQHRPWMVTRTEADWHKKHSDIPQYPNITTSNFFELCNYSPMPWESATDKHSGVCPRQQVSLGIQIRTTTHWPGTVSAANVLQQDGPVSNVRGSLNMLSQSFLDYRNSWIKIHYTETRETIIKNTNIKQELGQISFGCNDLHIF